MSSLQISLRTAYYDDDDVLSELFAIHNANLQFCWFQELEDKGSCHLNCGQL